MKYKYHYFYKITNTINNKYYYGIHSTNNLNDNYLGSGKKLISDRKLFGKENFIKEIIKYFDSREDASAYESLIVTEELIHDPLCYNVRCGGDYVLTVGTFLVIDSDGILHRCDCKEPKFISGEWVPFSQNKVNCIEKDTGNKISVSCEEFSQHRDKYISYTEKSIVVKDSSNNIFRVSIDDPRYISGELIPIWKGRKHSKETIQKMKNYKHPNGKEHSQYGFRWIHKDGITKKIPGYELDQYINSGWSKGRIFIPTEAFYRSQSKLNKEEIIKLLKEGTSKKKNWGIVWG